MRLTLRTLLAWLDDTLPPGEVRQIGQQVAESPLAGELVDKIHRVTRQRRLTVPPGSGPDGVDPNIVAGYLADELSPEVVAEYEKRCLTSDVTLAEVASVHQILSLLGQKAKVPAEAKLRMYHLIKGREAAPTPTSRPSTRKPEPNSMPVWSPEPIPPRSIFERFGPLAAVAALILVLCWSAYVSVGPTKVEPAVAIAPPAPKVDHSKEADKKKMEAQPVETPVEKPAEPSEKSQPEKSEPVEKQELPAGSVGVVGQGDFVLLRQAGASQSWERVRPGAVLKDGDRLINLLPFHTPIQVGAAKLTMIGDSEIRVSAAGGGLSSRFEIVRGIVKLTGTSKEPIALTFDSAVLKLTVPELAIAGLEVLHRRSAGELFPGAPGLKISATEGTVNIEVEGTKEELSDSSIGFLSPKTLANKAALDSIPMWLTDNNLAPGVQVHAAAFEAYFKPDRAAKSCLVEALDDASEDVRAYAIRALAAIGQLDLVISEMSKKDNPKSRRAAISALRDVARRSNESAKLLRDRLILVGGSKEWAEDVEVMLVGFPPTAANDEIVPTKLVTLLKHDDVGIRELAIETLQSISDRADRIGYDPDKPEDPAGVKAWADLVEQKALRIPPTPKR